MRTIRLYGVLRARFGREYRLDVASPREAISALCYMVPGFELFLRTAEQRGIVFAVFAGRENLGAGDLDAGGDTSDIRLAPIIQGSKNGGAFQLIVGAVLIVAGFFTGGTTTTMGMGLYAAGIGAAVGGVATMLSPTPKGAAAVNNEDGNNPSYGFGGPVTTVAQGNPYPLLYGEREIGGAVESAAFYTEDQL